MDDQLQTGDSVRWWDEHGEEITEGHTPEGDTHRVVLLNPVLFDLLGEVRGKRILDAGCGEGYLSRLLARRGANVLGIDYARKMLEIAGKRTPTEMAVEYRHGNFEDLSFLDDASFDIIVSNMALQDLCDYESAIKEAHRLLAPDGRFVFSISHPCFDTSESGWVRDDEGRKLHWKVDKYFCEGAYREDWPGFVWDGQVVFHRTLTSYFQAILKTGFSIEAVVEPKPAEEMLKKYPAFKDDFRMCHFIVFKLRK